MRNSVSQENLTSAEQFSLQSAPQVEPVSSKSILALICYMFIAAGCLHAIIPGVYGLGLPWGEIFGGALIILLFMEFASQGTRGYIFGREEKLVLCLIILGAVGIPLSLWVGGSLKVWLKLLKSSLLLYSCAFIVRRVVELNTLIRALTFSLLFLGLAAIAEGISHSTKGIGYTYDPNDIALIMVMGIPFCFYCANQAQGARKLLYFAVAFLFAGVIVLSASRGGFLGLISLVTYGIITMPSRRFILIVISAIGIIALLQFAPTGAVDRISTLWNPQSDYDRTAGERTNIWIRGVEIAMSKPLFGVGMGNFADAEGKSREGGHWRTAHNSFLQLGAEMGLPALLIFVALISGAFLRVRQLRKNLELADQGASPLCAAAQALELSLIGYMVCGFFLSQAYLAYLYFVLGLVASTKKLSSNLIPNESIG